MRSMIVRRDNESVRGEIVSIYIFTGLVRILPHVVPKVFMLIINSAVNYADNDIALIFIICGIITPCGHDIDVASTDR